MPACTDIVFCIDNHNLLQVSVVIDSILEHLAPGAELTFHVIYDGARDRAAARFARRQLGDHRLCFIQADAHPFGELPLLDHVTAAALLKLRLGELLPDVDRVLYLDADTLVLRDLRPLLATDLGTFVAAAVVDYGLHAAAEHERQVGVDDHRRHIRESLGRDPDDFIYVNSGVLLLDLATLRRESFAERATRLVLDRPARFRWRDQDAFNLLLEGRIGLLDPRWNVLVWHLECEERRHFARPAEKLVGALQRRDPWIVHLTGPAKPWLQFVDLPAYRLWWHQAFRTSPRWYATYLRLRLRSLMHLTAGHRVPISFQEVNRSVQRVPAPPR